MRKFAILGLVVIASLSTGCARPWEVGAAPAYTARDRWNMALRNMDLEGKMTQDDLDNILLLRPVSGLTTWNIH